MGYFPFFVNIENKRFLVIGGGKVAHRKIKTLLEFKADITVIAKEFCEEIIRLSKNNNFKIMQKSFDEIDIIEENYFCVVSCTNDELVNDNVSKVCKSRNILVNIADDIEKCDFIFPAIVKDDDVVIGVSTAGKSPTMSKVIKDDIKKSIPSYYGKLVSLLGCEREKIKTFVDEEKSRRMILKKLTDLGLEKEGDISEVDTLKIIEEIKRKGSEINEQSN